MKQIGGTMILQASAGISQVSILAKGGPVNAWTWIGFDEIFSLYNELKTKGITIRQPPINYCHF